jgi:hypothetical protein
VEDQLAALVHGFASMHDRSPSEEIRLCLKIGVGIHGLTAHVRRRPRGAEATAEWEQQREESEETLAKLLNKLIGADVPDELMEAALPEV